MNKTDKSQTAEPLMYNKHAIASGAIAGVVAMGLLAGAGEAVAAKKGFEKCAGIVKAGKNDCGNSRHGCSGQAAKDKLADEWLYVPNGTCKKIAGASIFVKKKK